VTDELRQRATSWDVFARGGMAQLQQEAGKACRSDADATDAPCRKICKICAAPPATKAPSACVGGVVAAARGLRATGRCRISRLKSDAWLYVNHDHRGATDAYVVHLAHGLQVGERLEEHFTFAWKSAEERDISTTLHGALSAHS